MYKTILCAIEVTSEGKVVLAKAVELAKLCDATLFVIHVIPYTLLPKDYQKSLKEDVTPKVERIAAAFNIPKKHQIVKVGKPYDHICTLADKKNIDLIMLGTHSKRGLNSLIGSTANGVVNYAKCDVSLVKI